MFHRISHSMCICTEEDYQKFLDGELIYDAWSASLVDPAMIDEEKRRCEEGWGGVRYLKDGEFYKLEWHSRSCYDEHFITPSGDKMVVFGVYGYSE